MGILKPAHGTWAEIKSKQTAKNKLTRKEEFEKADYSRDPIQAPRRMPNDVDTISTRSLIVIVVSILAVIGVLGYALSGVSTEYISPEREVRTEWQMKTRTMDCMALKIIIEQEPSDLPNTAIQFSYWEYTGAERVYPSPRPDDECYLQTGYLLDDVERCKFYGGFGGCNGYFFTRDETTKTIYFPKNWSYIDSLTNEKFTNPNAYIAKYYPDLKKWNGVINGTG